jgi:hypothetical protein
MDAKIETKDNEIKELLQQNLELEKQNQAMLQKLIRSQKLTTIYRIAYWSIIILSSVGAYYFAAPYFNGILDLYKNSGSSQQVQNFVNSIENKHTTPATAAK